MALDVQILRRRLEAIPDLPILSQVAARIASRINAPSTSAAEIGQLIEHDLSLTSRVLRLVNSAYYGFPRKIRSVQHAVVILGFSKIKSVVMTVSVFDLTARRPHKAVDPRRLWQHSVGVAIAAKEILSEIAPHVPPEDAFTGGLLHDIGKIIYDQYLPDFYEAAEKLVAATGRSLLSAEQETLGVTHAAVGRWLAERWRLPPLLQNVIAYHHQPARCPEDRDIVNAVHLADAFIRSLGVGNGGDPSINPVDEGVVASYNLDKEYVNQAMERIVAELTQAREFFDLVVDRDQAQ